MMHRSRRGAARVPIIWIVVVLVAFFAAVGMIFVFSGDAAKFREDAVAAQKEASAADQKLQDERIVVRQISELAGYYDRTAASARTQVSSMQEGLDQFKTSFGTTMGPDV